MRMQVGCGFRVKEIKRRDYVYFWHYEDRGGRRTQIYEYIGPRRSAATIRRLEQALEAYYGRAEETLRRELALRRSAIADLRL